MSDFDKAMSNPITAIERLRLHLNDPDSFDPPDYDDLGAIELSLDQLRSRIRELESIVDPLVAADDMWTDYGSGFRIHFSFGAGASDDVVVSLNQARATQKSGETDGD